MSRRVLVLAPHPDDEVLGPGGTIAKLAAQGAEVSVAVLTTAGPPLFSDDVRDTGRREAAEAHRVLGVRHARFLPFPAAGLDTVPHAELNAAVAEVFDDVRPDTVLVPFSADLHLDHQRTFLSAMVCARPLGPSTPRTVLAYETVSETNWNAPYVTPAFHPNAFVDISETLDAKLEALRCYVSQLRRFPHERSLEAVRALATLRGGTVGCTAAEAFVLIRGIR